MPTPPTDPDEVPGWGEGLPRVSVLHVLERNLADIAIDMRALRVELATHPTLNELTYRRRLVVFTFGWVLLFAVQVADLHITAVLDNREYLTGIEASAANTAFPTHTHGYGVLRPAVDVDPDDPAWPQPSNLVGVGGYTGLLVVSAVWVRRPLHPRWKARRMRRREQLAAMTPESENDDV